MCAVYLEERKFCDGSASCSNPWVSSNTQYCRTGINEQCRIITELVKGHMIVLYM